MDKCLRFQLPSGLGGQAAAYVKRSIFKKLDKLGTEGKIGKNIKTSTRSYQLYVWLEHEQDYTVFFLVWEFFAGWHTPTLVDKTYVGEE